MATVVSAPFVERRAARLCAQRTCDVAFIAARLGMSGRPIRAILDEIRARVRDGTLPEPASPRRVGGRLLSGADAVWKRSLWLRDDVELIFETRVPHALAKARAAAERGITRHQLAQRAQRIVEVA